MKKYLMKCGHIAQATDFEGKPVCAICAPYDKGVTVDKVIKDEKDGLEGRKARCSWCGHTTESRWNLPFFEYRPDKDTDSFYCGCGGWD